MSQSFRISRNPFKLSFKSHGKRAKKKVKRKSFRKLNRVPDLKKRLGKRMKIQKKMKSSFLVRANEGRIRKTVEQMQLLNY